MMLAIDLSGKIALVLGGSRGIGASIVEIMCRAGAHVTFTHTGNPAHEARVAELLARARATEDEAGGEARAEVADARDSAATAAVADRLASKNGGIDVLVCNAGMNAARPIEEVSNAAWTEGIELNLGTAFYGVRATLPHMLRRGRGRIILIGSSAVIDGGGGAIDYAAAKAGMTGMMTYLCRAYAKRGILTNIVHPCVIETDLLEARYAGEEAKSRLAAQIPVGRLGAPQDIAGLVAFLASSWGDYICGQEILADGGRTLYGGR